MGQALGAADQVVVMDVYPAREAPVAGVTGALVAQAVPLEAADVAFEPDPAAGRASCWSRGHGPATWCSRLGAGDVTEIGPQVLELLAERDEEQA